MNGIEQGNAGFATTYSGIAEPLHELYNAGIANELFPLLLFIGIGAMIDFGPLLSNPKLMIFGAAAQFGIFFTLCMASMFFPESKDFASIAIIGAADGPTSIVVANALGSNYIGAITVAAYSYMALVPIIQPPVIKALTTKNERKIRMAYEGKEVSKLTKILFPIVISIVACIFAPGAGSLIGFYSCHLDCVQVYIGDGNQVRLEFVPEGSEIVVSLEGSIKIFNKLLRIVLGLLHLKTKCRLLVLQSREGIPSHLELFVQVVQRCLIILKLDCHN